MASSNALDFEKLRTIGDEEADALLARLIPLSETTLSKEEAKRQADQLRELLLQLFAWTPASKLPVPAPVDGFLREPNVLPSWFVPERDLPRVARAQDLFDRFRLTALLVLGCASLPHCYAHGEIANTLTLSGLLGMRVRQRIEDTAIFVNAVMAPKSFVTGSAFPWIRKIRLIHATMRRLTLIPFDTVEQRNDNSLAGFLLARKWDQPKDGMPLDQLELAYVLLTFSYVVAQGWKTFRILPGRQEQADYLYTWALIGSALGVRDELLEPLRAGSLGDTGALFEKLQAIERDTPFGKDLRAKEKGRLLTATLNVLLSDSVLRAPLPALLRWVRPAADPLLRSLPRTLTRRLIGCPTALELWVDRPPFLQWIVHALIIEIVGFTDFFATLFGSKIRESGLWANVSIRFHLDVAAGLDRPLPPNAPASPPPARPA